MSKNELELLTLAAKAADLTPKLKYSAKGGFTFYDPPVSWNPLADDGDALRLAVKLGMSIEMHPGSGCEIRVRGEKVEDMMSIKQNQAEVVRYAIVFAAATLANKAEA